MTAIANYYAQVGVKLNKTDLRSVRTYLNSIEKQLNSFQSKLAKGGRGKGLGLNVNVRINMRSIASVQKELNTLSRNLTLNISNITFNRNGIGRALRGSTQGQSLRINATLSQQSISAIRGQLQQALRGITVPINARAGRVSGGGGSGGGGGWQGHVHSPTARRQFSPWHNPMMVGGGVGAFLRYGAYSLPFVAGAMGLNAMSNNMGRLQQTSMLLNTSSGSVMAGQEQMQFLSGLGNRLGFTTSGIAPFYAQMYAGSRGTALQDQLQEGFTGFMEYASVTGMSDEQKKGAARAISQMIAKRQVMAEELRGQLAEHGMPMAVQFMADAVAGGDVGKLSKMMERGEVDPIKALPKFFAALKAQATPFLNDFYNTIEYRRGKVEKANEDWMKAFMSGGAGEGISTFFKTWEQVIRDSIPHAETLGKILKSAAHYLSAAMLVPGEVLDWLKGGRNNFMQSLFGDVEDSSITQSIISLFEEVSEGFSNAINSMSGDLNIIVGTLTLVGNVLSSAVNLISSLMSMLNAYSSGGMEGLQHEFKRKAAQSMFRQQAINDLNKSGMPYDKSDIDSVTKAYMMDWDSKNAAPANIPQAPGTRKLWSGALGEGINEFNSMYATGNFSFQGLWDILNKDRSHLLNTPSNTSFTNSTGSFGMFPGQISVVVENKPIVIDAHVESSVVPEMMGQAVRESIRTAQEEVNNQILRKFSIIPQ